MDRTRRLLDELKMAEARSDGTSSWSEAGRRMRREVRRLRAAWEDDRASRFGRDRADDPVAETDTS